MSRYDNYKSVVVRMHLLLWLWYFHSASCLGMALLISGRPIDALVGLNKVDFLYIYICDGALSTEQLCRVASKTA